MDNWTPARTWAATETLPRPADDDAPMPLVQRAVMLAFIIVPLAGLVTALAVGWHRVGAGRWAVGWPEVVALLVMYAAVGFGVTVGYHRLLTHRSFATPRFVKLTLAVLGSAAAQGMTIRWVATHRRHHQQADQVGDPHSPHHGGTGMLGLVRGFWHAHLGWMFERDRPQLARSVPDLLADRGMLLVDRLYLLWVALGLLAPAVGVGLVVGTWHGFWSGLIWGGLVRIAVTQHVTYSVNSVCHIWGNRPYASDDHSTNNLTVAVLSLGEGWHNNHHAFPTSARHGLRWWQFDPSYLLICALKRTGLAWDVRLPTPAALAAKAVSPVVAV